MKKIAALIVMSVLLISLVGCLFPEAEVNDFAVALSKNTGGRPLNVTVTASGGSAYELTFDGNVEQSSGGVFHITATKPEEQRGTVSCVKADGSSDTVTFVIGFENKRPVIGRLRLNGIDDQYVIHAKGRNIADFPDARDPDGGPVTLVDVHVQASGKSQEDTVFAPPYAGDGVYHAYDRNGRMIPNAFVFHSMWTGRIDGAFNVFPAWKDTRTYYNGDEVNKDGKAWMCTVNGTEGSKQWNTHWEKIGDVVYGTNLPFSPPGYGESGYPGSGTNCDGTGEWPDHNLPSGTTTITATFEDSDGGRTTESWDVPTMPYVGCN